MVSDATKSVFCVGLGVLLLCNPLFLPIEQTTVTMTYEVRSVDGLNDISHTDTFDNNVLRCHRGDEDRLCALERRIAREPVAVGSVTTNTTSSLHFGGYQFVWFGDGQNETFYQRTRRVQNNTTVLAVRPVSEQIILSALASPANTTGFSTPLSTGETVHVTYRKGGEQPNVDTGLYVSDGTYYQIDYSGARYDYPISSNSWFGLVVLSGMIAGAFLVAVGHRLAKNK